MRSGWIADPALSFVSRREDPVAGTTSSAAVFSVATACKPLVVCSLEFWLLHFMEEVIGSIPIRSAKSFQNLDTAPPRLSVRVIGCAVLRILPVFAARALGTASGLHHPAGHSGFGSPRGVRLTWCRAKTCQSGGLKAFAWTDSGNRQLGLPNQGEKSSVFRADAVCPGALFCRGRLTENR